MTDLPNLGQSGLLPDPVDPEALVAPDAAIGPPAAPGAPGFDPQSDGAPAPALWPVDQLAGLYFWWDGAPPAQKRIYHGQIVATVDGSYVLLSFSPHADLAVGLLELVHISRIAEDNWSLFATLEHYQAAIGGDDDPA